MKRSVLLIALFGLFISTQAQMTRPHCYTNEVTDPLIASDPQYQQNRADLEQFTQQYIADQAHRRSANTLYIIPVVFHILHNYGPENVSDDVIRAAVARMNIDYRKMNADTDQIIPAFQGIAADCEIEFRLATIDPIGNCTNGIEHIPTLETYLANDSSKRNPNYMYWPTNKYVNIWVANSLENSGAAAYAHLPGGPNNTDGIMCWYTYVDNISRTLTHEMGHHLNLYHVWGNSNTPGLANNCSLTDQVSDTPPTKGWDHCPSPSQADICNPGTIENYQNYMEYSFCDVMFTQGQKQRMQACLNATASGRNNLWTMANLIATGTDQVTTSDCGPKADFKSDSYSTCAGSPIHFVDQSWNGTPTSWAWQFPGGTPSVSNDTNPVVVYNTPGLYTATLVVSNANGSDSITKSSIIHVSGGPTVTVPYFEDFEDTTVAFPGPDEWVWNNDGGPINWEMVNFASGGTGTRSIRVNNYINTVRNVEEWITPSMSFTGITFPIKISFKVAHAQRSNSTADELSVWYTSDCGMNWLSTSYSKSGGNLATNGGSFVTNSFTPNATQWRQEVVAVNAVQGLANVRFKFRNTTDHGNNVYIDDINITGSLAGIDEEDNLAAALSVYPNPSAGSTSVDFNLIKGSDISLEVKDVLGQSVAKVLTSKRFEAGLHHITLPVLSSGIYMINLTVNNKQHTVKLVVS